MHDCCWKSNRTDMLCITILLRMHLQQLAIKQSMHRMWCRCYIWHASHSAQRLAAGDRELHCPFWLSLTRSQKLPNISAIITATEACRILLLQSRFCYWSSSQSSHPQHLRIRRTGSITIKVARWCNWQVGWPPCQVTVRRGQARSQNVLSGSTRGFL